MSEWKEYKLDEIADIYNNKRIPLSSIVRSKRQGKYPYYGASGIVDYIDDYIFDGDYILISEDGENLRSRKTPIAFRAQGKFWVNNHAHIIQGKDKFLNNWISYFFKNLNVSPYLTGAVQPKLNKENLLRIPIPIPDFESASIITEILSSLDDKIELNNNINKELEKLAQTLFKQWFIEFEFPDENGEPYQSSGGEMVESELGMIPKNWEVRKLSALIRLTGGGTPKRSNAEYWDGKIKWFSIQDIPNDSQVFVVDTKEKITELGLNKSSTKLLPRGTTIITARGTVGKLALVAEPMAMNQSCYGVNGASGLGEFYTYFNLKNAVEKLRQNVHGAVFDTITSNTFDTIKSIYGNNDLANLFEEIVRPMMEQIENHCRENQELSNLRDTLLPKLISGELNVKDL